MNPETGSVRKLEGKTVEEMKRELKEGEILFIPKSSAQARRLDKLAGIHRQPPAASKAKKRRRKLAEASRKRNR